MKLVLTIATGVWGCLITVPCLQAQQAEKATADKPAAADTATVETDQDKEKKPAATPREQITKLIKDGQLKLAADNLDIALAADDTDSRLVALRRTLALAFSRQRNYTQAATQYAKLLDHRLADPKSYPAELVSLLSSVRVYYPRGGRADEVFPTIEKVEQHLAKSVSMDRATPGLRDLLTVHNIKAQSLQRDDSKAAEQLLRDDLRAMQALHTATSDKVSADLLAQSMRNLFQSLPDGEERSDLYATHQQLARNQIDGGNTRMFSGYMQAGMSQLGRIYRSQPAEAKKLMESLYAIIEEFDEDDDLKRVASSYRSSIQRYESRIESALKIAAMYDKPAPAIDADAAWVGVDKPQDLNGKVVLIDFWAIWCGPCIATFPHLRHLNEEYGDQGLEIVGVTRYYNYTWDEDSRRAKRGDRDAEADVEAEHQALQKFLASHDLKHPTIVVPKDSTMHKQFNVYGIPHAALIDRKGILRLVKVGSGSAGAEELEAKIKQLLAEN